MTCRKAGVREPMRLSAFARSLRRCHLLLIEIDRFLDLVAQILDTERLFEELQGAGLHRLHRHAHVCVSGNVNDRQLASR